MSTAGRAPSPAAPGVVQVRLLGALPELAALAQLLASLPGLEILTAHGPRPNRYDPGERVYLTVRIDLPAGAAHGRQDGPPPRHPSKEAPAMTTTDTTRTAAAMLRAVADLIESRPDLPEPGADISFYVRGDDVPATMAGIAAALPCGWRAEVSRSGQYEWLYPAQRHPAGQRDPRHPGHHQRGRRRRLHRGRGQDGHRLAARRGAGRAGRHRPGRRGGVMNPKLWVLIVALAVIARARVAVLPGWVVPLPVLVLAAEITACAAFIAWLVHRAPPGARRRRGAVMTAAITAAVPGERAARARPLTGGERRAVRVTAVLAGVLGLIGFANSFRAVADAARASFGPLAVTVPVGVDLGIAVFSALDIVLARLDLRPRWVRLVPWTLTAATVYLNVTGQPTGFARVGARGVPRAVGHRGGSRRARGPGPGRARRRDGDGPHPPVPLAAGPGADGPADAPDGAVGDPLLPRRAAPRARPAASADRPARHLRPPRLAVAGAAPHPRPVPARRADPGQHRPSRARGRGPHPRCPPHPPAVHPGAHLHPGPHPQAHPGAPAPAPAARGHPAPAPRPRPRP